jgi:hypothetical protein
MSDGGYTELLEILGRQMTQYFFADGILTKCRLVAFQTERLQPPSNIHRRFLRISRCSKNYLKANELRPGIPMRILLTRGFPHFAENGTSSFRTFALERILPRISVKAARGSCPNHEIILWEPL